MIEIKSYGSIKHGCFYPKNPKVYLQAIKDAGNVSDCLLTITGANRRTVDQNAYAHAVCNQVAVRVNQDGWNFTGYEVYKDLENKKCMTIKMNEITGATKETITPLKYMDTDRFFEIIEEFRQEMMQKLRIHIKTPAEFYEMTEEAYDLWRSGAITFYDAKKMSRDKFQPEEIKP